MKKILGLLGLLSFSTVSTTTVFACGPKKETEEITTSEERNQYRLDFIADVTKIINNHMKQMVDKLYNTKDQSVEKKFLSYENLVALFEDKVVTGKEITLDQNQLIDLKKDIDSVLMISSDLNNKIDKAVRNVKKYDFLLINVDRILNSIQLGDKIIVTSQKMNEDENLDYLITIDFSFEVSFTYFWNNSFEIENINTFDFSYYIMTEELISLGLVDLIRKLPNELWIGDKADKFLKWDEFDTEAEFNNTYDDQYREIETKLSDGFVAFKNYVDGKVLELIPDPDITYTFDSVEVENISRMYTGEVDVVPITNSYLTHTLLMKKINGQTLNDSQLLEEYNKEITDPVLNQDSFAKQEKDNIKNIFKINIEQTIEPENPEDESITTIENFVQYGSIAMQNVVFTYKGLNVRMNPINLLFTYQPTKPFALELKKVFNNWQELWGLWEDAAKDSFFWFKETTVAGQEFWKGENLEDPFAFAFKGDYKNLYWKGITDNTGMSSFYFTSENNAETSKPNMNSAGFSVNYWQEGVRFEQKNFELFKKSWQPILLINDTLTINLIFALNEVFWSSVWVGSGGYKGDGNDYPHYVIAHDTLRP